MSDEFDISSCLRTACSLISKGNQWMLNCGLCKDDTPFVYTNVSCVNRRRLVSIDAVAAVVKSDSGRRIQTTERPTNAHLFWRPCLLPLLYSWTQTAAEELVRIAVLVNPHVIPHCLPCQKIVAMDYQILYMRTF